MKPNIEISEFQRDALREHLNIGMGLAAGTLNQMLDTRVKLQVPQINIMHLSDFIQDSQAKFTENLATVTMPFKGNISGSSSVIFSEDSAARLVRLLVPESDLNTTELNSITEATLTEVGNIIINAVMGSLANLTKMHLRFNPPSYRLMNLIDILSGRKDKDDPILEQSIIIFGETFFHVEKEHIVGRILIAFLVSELQNLLKTWVEDVA